MSFLPVETGGMSYKESAEMQGKGYAACAEKHLMKQAVCRQAEPVI